MLKSTLKALIFIISFIVVVSIYSCKDQNVEQRQLYQRVMKTHDALMIDMDKIMDNKSALSQIQNNLDSLKQQNAALDTASINAKIKSMKESLDVSDNAMMKWMNNFDADNTGKTQAEIITYLTDQKIKIDAVKTLFTKSLSKSDSLITKYK